MPLLLCFLLPRVPSQGFILTYQTCRHPQWIHPLNRDRLTDTENRLVVTKEVTTRERGMNWAFGFGRCKLLRTEGIDNKVLLYSTGNYSPSPEINLMEQNIKKSVYVWNGITLLYNRNWHITVNQLHPSIRSQKKKKKNCLSYSTSICDATLFQAVSPDFSNQGHPSDLWTARHTSLEHL